MMTAVVLGAGSAIPAQAAASGGTTAVVGTAFAGQSVDATGGGVTDALGRTVTDSDPNATNVTGEAVVRQILPEGSATGPAYDETFTCRPGADYRTFAVSGTAQSSTYSWDFPYRSTPPRRRRPGAW
jgi:hypothetical protein